MPELSVVVPTLRRHAELARTMAALAAQTAADFEVIVVADAEEPDPAAVAVAATAPGRPARLLQAAAPGASAARNAGWRAAAAPVCLFLADDILAAPGLVERHVRFHAREPAEEAALLGHVRWADELRVTPLMAWLQDGVQSEHGRLDAGGDPGWWDFVTQNVSVKRALLERAGGFDERTFPFLYEDTDLGLRLHELGMRLRYDPGARAEHLHRPTPAQWRERMAATARAEHRFVSLHPEIEPYFERRLRAALAERRGHGRVARALFTAGIRTARVRRELDLHYRQAFAPAFLAAWDEVSSAASR